MKLNGSTQAWKRRLNSHMITLGEVLKLAASGKTVYVGKRDGHLLQSLDGGNSWNDITPNLPMFVEHFIQIAFADATVHVATDKGVIHSKDGVVWNVLTDKTGEPVIIKSLATAGDSIYGANDEGIYHLQSDTDTWEQVAPENFRNCNLLWLWTKICFTLARNDAVCCVLHVRYKLYDNIVVDYPAGVRFKCADIPIHDRFCCLFDVNGCCRFCSSCGLRKTVSGISRCYPRTSRRNTNMGPLQPRLIRKRTGNRIRSVSLT